MNLKQLGEDIIDDILADFPQFRKTGDAPSQPKFTPQPSSARPPIKIQGVEHEDFSQWLRSISQVRQALQDTMGSPKLSLSNCIKLYTEHNFKIDDYVKIHFPTTAVYPYREYDRDMQPARPDRGGTGWTGKMTSEEYTDLMKNIEKRGIEFPGLLEIGNGEGGNYKAILGEGNHRLRIALALNIDSYPLTFGYPGYRL